MKLQPSWDFSKFAKICENTVARFKTEMAPGKFSPGLGRAVSKWSACAVELFFTGLMDISDGHRADNPEDSCASVKRSQIAPYGAVWPFHLCLLRRDVRVCGGGASSCFLLKI